MKVKPEDIQEVNFGVSVKVNDQKKGTDMTGVYPSPSLQTLEAVVRAAVDFLNEQLGTKLIAVPMDELEEAVGIGGVVDLDELEHICGGCGEKLQQVRPGKYQCVNCEGKEQEYGKQTARVAIEAD